MVKSEILLPKPDPRIVIIPFCTGEYEVGYIEEIEDDIEGV